MQTFVLREISRISLALRVTGALCGLLMLSAATAAQTPTCQWTTTNGVSTYNCEVHVESAVGAATEPTDHGSATFTVNNPTSQPWGHAALFKNSNSANFDFVARFESGYTGKTSAFGAFVFYRPVTEVGNGNGLHFSMKNVNNNNETEYGGFAAAIESNGGSNGINGALTFLVTENGSTRQEKMRLTSEGTLRVSKDITAGGTIEGANVVALYQDVAEWVPSRQKLSGGTVVVLDQATSNHVLASASPYDTRVAGVVSERPGITLGEQGTGKVLVATTGRVKVKVDATRAPIGVGDLLVTGEVEGTAMKSIPVELGGVRIHRPGTIIGKALEPLAKGTGEILVLLSLQ